MTDEKTTEEPKKQQKSDMEYLKLSIETLKKHASKNKTDKSMQRSLHKKQAKLLKLEKKA